LFLSFATSVSTSHSFHSPSSWINSTASASIFCFRYLLLQWLLYLLTVTAPEGWYIYCYNGCCIYLLILNKLHCLGNNLLLPFLCFLHTLLSLFNYPQVLL
jgi:hypothetical protein